MQRVPFSALSENKQDIIEMSLTIPRMYMTVEDTVFDQNQNCTFYIIEIGVEEDEENVLVFTIKTRYSEMLKFDRQIRQCASDEVSFLRKFPPKKFFMNNDSQFVAKRRTDIEGYLENLTQIPGIVNYSPFTQLFSGPHVVLA